MGKYLIINADDFGMSHEFNAAIADLLTNKYISSTSIMANGCAYHEAVSLIRAEHLNNIGVHLTLTRDAFAAEEPLIYHSLTSAESLEQDERGLYTSSSDLTRQAKFDDIVSEIKAQIQRVSEDGIDYTHIDNHMYSLMPRMGYEGYRAFFKAYHGINNTPKVCGVRIAKDYYNETGLNYVWGGRKNGLYARPAMRLLGLRGLDYCFAFPYYAGEYSTLEAKTEMLDTFFRNMRNGVTELHIHPCVYSDALKRYNPFWENRVQEYEMLKQFGENRLKNEYGITMISYRDVK